MAKTGLRKAAKRAYLELMRRLPDWAAVSADYFRVFGHIPNLKNPRRFSEKIQHLKLFDRDPRLPALVDKLLVKDYVAEALGEEWLIPTLWHGERVDEKVLRDTPKPAVLKANHSSAQILFLRPESDLAAAARTANSWLHYDHHVIHREWAYGAVRRQLLIEPMVGGEQSLDDYKFWVFDGEVRFIQVDHGRFKRHTRQFYAPDWRRLDLRMNYPETPSDTPPPRHLGDMRRGAATLARGFPFVRVDLYDAERGPLFGELTFAPEAGLTRFQPARFDLDLGESWSYPRRSREQENLRAFSDAFRLNKDKE